jgi:hypothetical protein
MEFGGSEPAVMSSSRGGERRTVHDIELEVQRVTLELQRLEREGDDVEAYCVDLANEDPTLYVWLLAEHCPEEAREAALNVFHDHPELIEQLVTYH